MISYEDFSKLDLRVAKIISVEKVEGSEKLLKIQIDVGELGQRQILAGIGKKYTPEVLIGKEIVIVANLEPRKLMGEESQGMLLAASHDQEGPVLLVPDSFIEPGANIK